MAREKKQTLRAYLRDAEDAARVNTSEELAELQDLLRKAAG